MKSETTPGHRRVTLHTLRSMKQKGARIASLTAYDHAFAALLDRVGVDVVLVGDSLGMVVQGHDSTLPVRMPHMVYHTACVARGVTHALVVADMPFDSYQADAPTAFRNAARLMRAGAHMVKLEGGAAVTDTVRFLVERGIPVCGHLGLTPQSVNQLGGYRVQGRVETEATTLKQDARGLEAAGAALLVLEAVPSALAGEVTRMLGIPVIGIGAGPDCDGQVLVLYDLLGITPGGLPRFARNFLSGQDSAEAAVRAYVEEVRAGRFPDAAHTPA